MENNQTGAEPVSESRCLLRAYALLGLLIAGASGVVRAQSQKPPLLRDISVSKRQTDRAAILKWVKESLVPLSTVTAGSPWEDLRPLGKMIGNAGVVALGEGFHFGAEPLEFRNRVLRYLVEEKGFTAIAIESGITESRTVHDYVRGGSGDLPTVVAKGFSWRFDQLPQNQALVRWLREYNADPRHVRKVNFYGFDVPGSPGNPLANGGTETGLAEALKYLSSVDSAATAAFHARLDPLLTSLRFDPSRPNDGPAYTRLSQAERDAVTAAIADLVTLLERREAEYTAASTVSDYEWAYRAAIGARQVDGWLRQIPVRWQPTSEQVGKLSVAGDVRDRAQADNFDWIVRQEGAFGKILVFAHTFHLSTAPVTRSWWPSDGGNQDQHTIAGTYRQEVMGTYLRRRFGGRLITIGNLIGKGYVACSGFKQTLKQAPPGSIAGLAGEVGAPLYLLDLRAAPAQVANWLDQERQFTVWNGVLGLNMVFELAVGRAFDVLFYVDTVTPACPG